MSIINVNGFTWVKECDGGEIYKRVNEYIMFVWGYSTAGNDVEVSRWEGEELEVEELPLHTCDGWNNIDGFDIDDDEEDYNWNWNDYEASVKSFLT